MSAPNLRSAAAAAMGAALMLAPMAFASKANAEDGQGAPTYTAASYTNVSLAPDAGNSAVSWSRTHPVGAAVAVYLGTSGDLPPNAIEESVRRGFAKRGVNDVEIYFEQNDAQTTLFSLHENGNSYGFYFVTELGAGMDIVAGQVKLMQANPDLYR